MKNMALIKARKAKNLSQWTLALDVGLKSGGSISLYENYNTLPSFENAQKISSILDVDVYYLWPDITED